MKDFRINNDPYFFPDINYYGLAENFLREIYVNVHKKNLSHLGIVTGQHRVGKSVSAVLFADILDPTFSPNFEDRVVYHPDTFMDAFEKIKEDKIKGAAVVWDETQIKHGSRDWYSSLNKSINSVIQAFGYLNPIVYFVTQDPSFIDSQPRKLFHNFFEVLRTSNTCSYLLPFDIKYNRRVGKPYYVYPRMRLDYFGSMGYRVKMNIIKVLKPDNSLIKRYDIHSQNFKDKFLSDTKVITQELREAEKERRDVKSTPEVDIVDDLVNNHLHDKVLINNRGNYRIEEVKYRYKISFRKSSRICNRANVKRDEILNR